MKLPRWRLTIKGTMVLIVLFALASLAARAVLNGWQPTFYRNPVNSSRLDAHVPDDSNRLNSNEPVPVTIGYDFQFDARPTPGTTVTLYARVWFEDMATGRYVDGYSFDVALTGGGRERAKDEFVWEAVVTGVGGYLLRHELYFITPSGKPQCSSGGSTMCRSINVEASPTAAGAAP